MCERMRDDVLSEHRFFPCQKKMLETTNKASIQRRVFLAVFVSASLAAGLRLLAAGKPPLGPEPLDGFSLCGAFAAS